MLPPESRWRSMEPGLSPIIPLSAIERPVCPRCQTRMMLARISLAGQFEQQSFECPKCDEVVTKTFVTDPMKSDAVGWLKGELKPPD
jgi:hypothetical protein